MAWIGLKSQAADRHGKREKKSASHPSHGSLSLTSPCGRASSDQGTVVHQAASCGLRGFLGNDRQLEGLAQARQGMQHSPGGPPAPSLGLSRRGQAWLVDAHTLWWKTPLPPWGEKDPGEKGIKEGLRATRAAMEERTRGHGIQTRPRAPTRKLILRPVGGGRQVSV